MLSSAARHGARLSISRVATQCSCALSSSSSSADSPPRLMDLVLIRHGESEGNVARKRSLMGDHSLYQGEFLLRHSSLWRLTNLGREQARAAGRWLNKQFPEELQSYDRLYTSEYLRAMETAGLLDLDPSKNPAWYGEIFLRERDWGSLDLLSQAQRQAQFRQDLARRERDRFFWTPPAGESLAAVCLRADRLINQLHRELPDQKALIVAHGEVMWAFRARLERMSQKRFREMEKLRAMEDHIHNGQILHYTRRNPITGEVSAHFTHMLSVCPWDEDRSGGAIDKGKDDGTLTATGMSLARAKRYKRIHRPLYSNQALLTEASHTRRLIMDGMGISDAFSDGGDAAGEEEDKAPEAGGDDAASSEEDPTTTREAKHRLLRREFSRNTTERAEFKLLAAEQGWVDDDEDDDSDVGESPPKLQHAHGNERGGGGGGGGGVLGTKRSWWASPAIRAMDAPGHVSFKMRDDSASNNVEKLVAAREKAAELDLKEVLLVCKTSRLEFEYLKRNKDEAAAAAAAGATAAAAAMAGEEEELAEARKRIALEKELRLRGLRYSQLHEAHEAHTSCLREIEETIRKSGIDVRVVKCDEMTPEDTQGVDAVFCAGGDGTFLQAATHIRDPMLPCIGINTDPDRSSGALCSVSMHNYVDPSLSSRQYQGGGPFADFLRRMQNGNFEYTVRARMAITTISPEGEMAELPHYALNEVFVGERDPSRPTSCELKVDSDPTHLCRSSGLVVATGTGSSAWMHHATRIPIEDVDRILREANAPKSGLELAQITDRVNEAHLFDAASSYLEYLVREPVLGSANGTNKSRHGWGRMIELRSLGFDTVMVVDAAETTPMAYGTRVVCSTSTRSQLLTVAAPNPLRGHPEQRGNWEMNTPLTLPQQP